MHIEELLSLKTKVNFLNYVLFFSSPEPFTLIVRKDSGITSFEGLKGKKVNVGNPGSGQRATMEVVMESFGMKMSDFSLAAELKGSEMAQAICDGKIEAMIYTVGHPAAAVKELHLDVMYS